MRIVLDQDQILCQWVERILEWYNEDKGTSCTRDDITGWNMTMNLGPHSEDFLRSCMCYPELYRDLDPVEGAIYGVRRLMEKGYDVIVCTAVPKCAGIAYHGKLEWLRRNMPFFPLDNFVAAQRKYLLDADILLDDGLHNIGAWARWPGRQAVIFDCPWNRNETELPVPAEGSAYHRVRHWNEFLTLIEELGK